MIKQVSTSDSGVDTRFHPLTDESDSSIVIQIIGNIAKENFQYAVSTVNSLESSLISFIRDGMDLVFTKKLKITKLPNDCLFKIASKLSPAERKNFFLALSKSKKAIDVIETEIENKTTRELNKLKQSEECLKFFGHILNDPNITSKRKLRLIKNWIKQEASFLELTYKGGSIREIIEYMNSDERKVKIALAEMPFTDALVKELNIESLNKVYTDSLISNNPNLTKIVKAQRLHNAIIKWQNNNPDIVGNITKIDLYNKGINFIPSYMGGFINLTILDLSHNQITDVSSLANLKSLQGLYLYDNQIAEISSLHGLEELDTLNLAENQITGVSLNGLDNLEGLELAYNQIMELSSLAGLGNLQPPVLSQAQTTVVSSLVGLKKLKRLLLYKNQIRYVSLDALPNLKYIALYNNPVYSVDCEDSYHKLKNLKVHYSKIINVNKLEIPDCEID